MRGLEMKKEQKTEGRVLARVISEEALKNITAGQAAGGYWTSTITEGGCDITNVGGDDDGFVEP
jgi:hypothetical protein